MAKSKGKGTESKSRPPYPQNKPATTGNKSGRGRSNNTPQKDSGKGKQSTKPKR